MSKTITIYDLEDEFIEIEELDVALLGQCDNWLYDRKLDLVIGKEINPYIIDTIRTNTLDFQRNLNDLIHNQKILIEKMKEKNK